MNDLLVNLYALDGEVKETYKDAGVTIHRILSPDSHLVKDFIRKQFSESWVSEVSVTLTKVNPSCFIAMKDKEVIGFGAYDATAKGYFGPTGVREDFRGQGIGSALLLKCLHAMKEEGYGYAIIGSVGKAVHPFYHKACGAVPIENSTGKQRVYSRMVTYN